jgi:hypothetical protein
MPLDAPISIAQQANNLHAVLDNYATQRGGEASVVSNLKEWWNQSAINNDIPRILICYMGENSRGSFNTRSALNRVDRTWNVAVIRGRGFSANRGDSLTKTVVNAIPFLQVVEDVRDTIRTILNISEEFPVEFLSIKPMSFGTTPIDGYIIEFVTANDIPNIILDAPLYPDPSGQGEQIVPPETPSNLGINWDVYAPRDYELTWFVSTPPLVGFTVYFSKFSGGPYLTQSVPAGSGVITYRWINDGGSTEVPSSRSHEDMYLRVEADNGSGNTSLSDEFHGVYGQGTVEQT